MHTNCHHQVNFVKINLKCPPPPPHERRVWHYGRANNEAIQRSLTEFNWEQALSNLDSNPEEQVELFDNVIRNVAENFIPFDDKLIKPRDPPWITKNSKTLYNKYRRKYKQFIRNGCKDSEKLCIDAMRSEYSNLVKNEKEKYLCTLGLAISDPNTGPKKYWAAMKKILKKNITSVIPPILQNGIFITDIKEKCKIFNEYFKDQCKTIVTSSVLPPHVEKTTTLSLNHVNFTESRILEHICGLNINKAHGHDGIPIRILKICDKSISKPLFLIYKNCISKGYFPKKWKKANVVPVYKKNERNTTSNYRPISLLPVCGKILEKLIFDNLYSYIFQNNFISDKQSGYRFKDSTVKQLLSITHEIFKAFDSSEEIRAVFLDISRAFDRVWHAGLTFKLQKIGIGGEMINILENFLSDREQRVALDGQFSDWARIEAGVPQGSILGPILFLIYINDLIEIVDSNIKIFADDTFIFCKADQNSTEILTNDLNKITTWAHKWKMSFNPNLDKQAVEVIFSNKRTPSNFDTLFFAGIPVKKASETKHIGMLLDSKLNFEKHVEDKLAKTNQGLGMMKHIKKWVSSKTLEQIYKLYVRPNLDYGDILYHSAELGKRTIFTTDVSNSLSKRIEMVQYEAARIVTGAWKGTSREKIYEDLGWESLSDRRIQRKLTLIFEIQQDNFPRYLMSTLESQQYNEGSRFFNKMLLRTVPCRLNKYKASFFPSTIIDWNMLDDDTKNSVSKSAFKKKILNKIRPKKKSYFGLNNENAKYITLLRMGLSPLRAHKFKYKFSDTTDPFCTVCDTIEDTGHYLLQCSSYRLSRSSLLQNISNILGINVMELSHKSKIKILLYGNVVSEDELNKRVLEEVTKFISKSKRLDVW